MRARHGKPDRNHGEVTQALERRGWLVARTTGVGGGFFDLIACKGGRVVFMEVKNPKRYAKPEPHQVKVHDAWRNAGADVRVVERVEDLP